jgi:predicted nucleic acid-binding protein
MIAYVDSSVLLRLALGHSNALPEWRLIDRGVSSALISTESLRTLDRVRIRTGLSDTEVAKRLAAILNLIDLLELIEVDSTALDRAAQPMPTELGTLDAIRLRLPCSGRTR